MKTSVGRSGAGEISSCATLCIAVGLKRDDYRDSFLHLGLQYTMNSFASLRVSPRSRKAFSRKAAVSLPATQKPWEKSYSALSVPSQYR